MLSALMKAFKRRKKGKGKQRQKAKGKTKATSFCLSRLHDLTMFFFSVSLCR
jgi:hypothetical protein